MTVVQTFSVAIINPLGPSLHHYPTYLRVSSSACPHRPIRSVDASLSDHSKSQNLFLRVTAAAAAVRYVDITYLYC